MDYGQTAGRISGGPDRYVNGSGGAQATMPAPSPVMIAQKQLDDATDRLHHAIATLQERLQPVLGPSKPSGDSACSPPPAGVASRIAQSASSVAIAIDRIDDLLSRLEI